MDIYFYSPQAFESWDWRNPDNQGIGGSETSHIEMAIRLAKRGHRVISYSPIADDTPRNHGGVEWRHLKEADLSLPGLWVLYRCPEVLDEVGKWPDQQAWLICQDEDYVGKWTDERMSRLDRVVALCHAQAGQFLERYPQLRGKVCVSSNGLKAELIEKVWAENLPRNPKRIMYASSPDRALVPVLNIFARIREYVPDAELHVAYGFDNIDKIVERVTQSPGKKDAKFLDYVSRLKAALQQPGIVWHGRLGQHALYREWAKTGIWLYPCSRFRETSCITCMEASALGAVPVYSPLWGQGENTLYGIAIDGDHADPLTAARFAQATVALMQSPEKQEALRQEGMREVRRVFTWERFVDQWEAWMGGWVNGTRATEQQHAFHLANLRGRVLNVGCNDDAGELGRFGVNVDVMSGKDPWTGRELKADIIADARRLPASLNGNFDTVVLSDILEHFEDSEAVKALKRAKDCLRPGGRITVSVPEDYSDPNKRDNFTPGQKYTKGVYAYHWRPCTIEHVMQWANEAGLTCRFYRPIDYGFCFGHGFVFKGRDGR